jgi:hypothetical protein
MRQRLKERYPDMTATTARIEHLPRPRRRLLVAVGLIGYPLAVAALAALKHTGLNRWLILSIFLLALLPTVAALLASYGYARGRIDGRRGCLDGRGVRLDERDIALRQQAYAASHRVLAVTLIAAAAILTMYLTSGNSVRLDANTFLPAAMWVVLYIPALPSLMLAWIETDQPADA